MREPTLMGNKEFSGACYVDVTARPLSSLWFLLA